MSEKLELRMFEALNYEEVCHWWTARSWPHVPIEALSQFGMLVHNKESGTNVCAGWLYLTCSSIAWVEWFVTNPAAPLKERRKGIELLLQRLITEALGFKATQIFSSLKSKSLIKLYKSHGFKEADVKMTNLVYTPEVKP